MSPAWTGNSLFDAVDPVIPTAGVVYALKPADEILLQLRTLQRCANGHIKVR
jgi:hypothetical protein